MTTQDEIDRLTRLHRRATDAGLGQGTPEDRTLMRVLVDKIADLYVKVIRASRDGSE